MNRPQARRCSHCGAALAQVPCPHCGTVNRAGAKYCHGCAAALTRSGIPTESAGTGRLPGGILLNNRYTITTKLAQGGMSAVYKVRDSHAPHTEWALKEMSLESSEPDEVKAAIEDFHQEAELLRTLRHPNLVKVTDRFSEQGKEYLVMEYIQGETLEEKADSGLFTQAEVFSIAFQLCDVLEYLHEQNPPIIYRDLKPGNMMLETGTGLLKLIDFGIVRFYKPGQSKDTKLLGTPGFAPPEQYGKGQTDARSDIFALGVTLLVLLTGYDVTQNPWSYPPASRLNPQVTTRLEQVIQKATEIKVADRYQSIAQMRTALKRCRGAKKVFATLPSADLKSHAPPAVSPAALPHSPGKAPPKAAGGSAAAIAPPGQTPAPTPTPQSGAAVQPAPQNAAPSGTPPRIGTPPGIGPRGIAPPQSASPHPTATLHITPSTLQLNRKKSQETVRVSSAAGQVLPGQATSAADWLTVQPETFNAAQITLNIRVDAAQVPLPKMIASAPPWRRRAWQWATARGATARPWRTTQAWRETLLYGAPALLGGGLAQLLISLVYAHARLWASGTAHLDTAVRVQTSTTVNTIPVHVELSPALHRRILEWVVAVVAVVGEIVILIWIVGRLIS